jgi:hypothetical protein
MQIFKREIMSKKKRSTSRGENIQSTSTIKFWFWSIENVKINRKTLIQFFVFLTGTITIVGISAIAFIYALIKLDLFKYVIRVIEAFKA